MKKLQPLGRRTLLRGSACLGVALPWLEAMRSRAAEVAPKRFVVLFSSCGTIYPAWNPQGTEQAFELSPILSPLERFKNKLIVLRGADGSPNAQGAAAHDVHMVTMLTCIRPIDVNGRAEGTAGGPSIDQEIARVIGNTTPRRSLELGVLAQQPGHSLLIGRMCYRAPHQPLLPENDPRVAFANLFGAGGGEAPRVDTLAALHRQRRSVLDLIRGDFADLDRRLGAEDRRTLDAHLAALRETEQRLVAMPTDPLLCGELAAPPSDLNVRATGAIAELTRLQLDILSHALVCDLTRVASLQWNAAESWIPFTFLGAPNIGHHDLSHRSDPEAVDGLVKINTWYAQQVAYLAGRLSDAKEGDGSVLDRSIVWWTNELGDGQDHHSSNLPNVILGSAGGALRTGRYITVSNTTQNDLMVSFLNAMDIPATTFGDPMNCKGPIAALS